MLPGSYKAVNTKVSNWWRNRQVLLGLNVPGHRKGNITAMAQGGKKRNHSKAIYGPGRKRARWVEVLYAGVYEEYARLNAANVKTPFARACRVTLYCSFHFPFFATV